MAQGQQENVERGARLIARSGLRYDKVALGFIRRLQESLGDRVPAGKTLIVTCTAPIRKDSKTFAELETVLAALLAKRPARLDFKKTVNANEVRARFVKRTPAHANAVVGFVHNPGVDTEELLSS
ncbi:MAG TPA: hypothetical protein VFE36_00225 [Candidatus Baltobacteraceae bacterium]|jgi:hypothetical protein|nr:hypothetical protein [Candidatus Baltobacteraceae bacterium]